MNTKHIVIFAAMSIILSGSSALAVTPGIPHQFFGDVAINGAPAPDGTTVSAKINSATVSSTTTSGGTYGHSPKIFYVDDPDANRAGSIIEFFVNGVDAGSAAYFANGKSEQVDLSVTIASQIQNTQNSGGGSSGSSGGGGSPVNPATNVSNTSGSNTTKISNASGPCKERWSCGEWSDCIDGIQKKSCVDANKCGTVEDIPLLSQPCGNETSAESLSQETPKSDGMTGITGMMAFVSGTNAYIIGAAVLIGLGAYLFSKTAKQKKVWK